LPAYDFVLVRLGSPAEFRVVKTSSQMCLYTFKQIVPRFIEQDDVAC